MNGTDFRKDIFGSYISWHWRGSGVLLPVWRLNIVTIVAGAGRWQLEGLDGEGEVMIVRVIDQEPGHRDTVMFRAVMRTSRNFTVPREGPYQRHPLVLLKALLN